MAAIPASAKDARIDEAQAGLLWNRSGLPATFPLLVQTRPGQDYRIVLHDPDADRALLAAAIHGGDLLRVLVPPGRFEIDIYGPGDPADRGAFLAADHLFTLDLPLSFGPGGVARKDGYIVDLRAVPDGGVATVRATATCQTVGSVVLEYPVRPEWTDGSAPDPFRYSRRRPGDFGEPAGPLGPPLTYGRTGISVRSHPCD